MDALLGAIAAATANDGANAPEGTIDRVETSDDSQENLMLQLAATLFAEIALTKSSNIETQVNTDAGYGMTATFQISCTLVRVAKPDGTVIPCGRPKPSSDLN